MTAYRVASRVASAGLAAWLLPSREDTLLLRACLLPDDRGRQSWTAWLDKVKDPLRAFRSDRHRRRRLAPMIGAALGHAAVAVPRDFSTYVRAAYVYEQRRLEVVRALRRVVLDSLARREVVAILLRGAALSETIYARPAFRHWHDIDVLVAADQIDSAIEACRSAGFLRTTGSRLGRAHVMCAHESGFVIALHSQFFERPADDVSFDEIRHRSEVVTVDNGAMRVPSSSDHLLHVCGHAAYSRSRRTLQWACDASVLAGHGGIDWRQLQQATEASGLAFTLSVMFHYLAVNLAANIPRGVVEQLAEAAAPPTTVRRTTRALLPNWRRR